MYFFIHGGGGAFQKITLMRGGPCEKNRKLGGVIQFSNYTPPNPTSPPYPIKNERSLKQRLQLGFASVPFFIFPFSVLRISTSSFLAQKLVDLSLRKPNDETVTKDIYICTAIKMNVSLQGTLILFYLGFLQHFAITKINPVCTAVNSFTSCTVKFYKTYPK